MPFGDPRGSFASGGAVNQGGPSGPNSPGNMGNMGGGAGGSNVRSAYAGSRPMRQSYTIPFGWQPQFPGQYPPQLTPEQEQGLFNPAVTNYTNNPISGYSDFSNQGFLRDPAWGRSSGGAGGSNSGQGGMGAGSLGNGILSILMQSYAQPRRFSAASGHKIG